METKKVVSTLNDLIETCKDGQQGYETAAEHATNPQLKATLNEGARRCAESARELQTEVRNLGEDPDKSGSAAGAVHRGWVNIKSAITGKDDKAILEEVERGEDAAVKSYRKALEADLPANIRSVVQRQYQGAEQNHAQARQLRDQYRAQKRS